MSTLWPGGKSLAGWVAVSAGRWDTQCLGLAPVTLGKWSKLLLCLFREGMQAPLPWRFRLRITRQKHHLCARLSEWGADCIFMCVCMNVQWCLYWRCLKGSVMMHQKMNLRTNWMRFCHVDNTVGLSWCRPIWNAIFLCLRLAWSAFALCSAMLLISIALWSAGFLSVNAMSRSTFHPPFCPV